MSFSKINVSFKCELRILLGVIFLLNFYSNKMFAFAGPSGESFCYSSIRDENISDGYAIYQQMPIASISKLFVSFWALRELGANYRFVNKIYISKVDEKSFDLHIAGSQDPMMNHQMVHFLISELNRIGVFHVRRLSFDRKFQVAIMVRENPGAMGPNGPNLPKSNKEVQENISLLFNRSRWGKTLIQNYQTTRAIARKRGIEMVGAPSITVSNVETSEGPEFLQFQVFNFQSSSLLSRLKDMNVYSNNRIADDLFYTLGGREEFHRFIQRELQLTPAELVFYTGSGLPWKPNSKVRKDNLANCEIIIKVLKALNSDMERTGYPIFKLLLLAGIDGFDGRYYSGNFYEGGTMGKFYSQGPLNRSIAGKTGTLDTLKSLAGVLYTVDGLQFFSMIKKVRDSSQYETAKSRFLNLLNDLFQKKRGPSPVKHTFEPFLPFDIYSGLQNVSK